MGDTLVSMGVRPGSWAGGTVRTVIYVLMNSNEGFWTRLQMIFGTRHRQMLPTAIGLIPMLLPGSQGVHIQDRAIIPQTSLWWSNWTYWRWVLPDAWTLRYFADRLGLSGWGSRVPSVQHCIQFLIYMNSANYICFTRGNDRNSSGHRLMIICLKDLTFHLNVLDCNFSISLFLHKFQNLVFAEFNTITAQCAPYQTNLMSFGLVNSNS